MKICSVCRRCYEDTVFSCIEENHDSLVAARPGNREIITDYRLDFLLECDAISETYAATNVSLDQPCAVKTVDANVTGIGQQLREGFLSEARTAAAIDHPNVVRVFESGALESNEFYAVTELVEGQTLRACLNGVGSLSEKDAVMIARQIAEGLEAAHAAGVPHRNLNLTNIILTSSPENARLIKIQNFDFGNVAQAAAFAIPDSEAHLNWLRYSSPEQCAAQATDARTDIYSLGVVLYEMLGGQPPFDAPDAAELIRRQINESPPPVKISNFDIRALLTHTLTQALQKNPTRRLSSANAFVRQLRHIEQLMTRSPMPVQSFERISAPYATAASTRTAENNAFAAKSGNSSFQETQPSIQKIAETVIVNPAETEQTDLPKETVLDDITIENISPAQPELIFVKRKKADEFQAATKFSSAESELVEDVQSERETIRAEKEQFDYADFAPRSFRLADESVVDSSEPESVISPAANIEETSARPAATNLLFSYGAVREPRRSKLLSRPMVAGAWIAALIVSAIIGVLLSEKFQSSAAQPPIAAAPSVSESASLPKSEEQTFIEPKSEELIKPKFEEPILNESRNTAATEESETEETDESDLEKYTPVKFEKPATATPLRAVKSQPLKEKIANSIKAERNTSLDEKLAPKEKTADAPKAKQHASPNKKFALKKQISAPTDRDIFMRPRIAKESGALRKN